MKIRRSVSSDLLHLKRWGKMVRIVLFGTKDQQGMVHGSAMLRDIQGWSSWLTSMVRMLVDFGLNQNVATFSSSASRTLCNLHVYV